jgi:nucleotide sugar dehydrogenase
VNIGLANQFARHSEQQGIDVYNVIRAANSQPSSHIHQPGIAVGGHCIPVYPRLYLWKDPDASVVRSAREANAAMPEHAVELLAHHLGTLEGVKVVVLGAAYRGGVKETAFSGIHATAAALEVRGAAVLVHDPLYSDGELSELGFTPYHLGESADAAMVQADHDEYHNLNPSDLPGIRAVLDGRNMLDESTWAGVKIIRLGVGQH